MATEVILPRVDMDMAEGKIAFWYVKDGDAVQKGQVLFDIETDKATMEIDAPCAGTVAGICGEVGVSLPVGRTVAWILAAGETVPGAAADTAASGTAPAASGTPAAPPAAPAASDGAADAPPAAPAAGTGTGAPGAMLRATPLARSMARARGLDLRTLVGSGPGGRVLARDLPPEGSAGAAPAVAAPHLHWWRRTAGVPVVLLHGFGADHASWRPLVQQLPDAQPVLGIDLPGHGRSAALPDVGLPAMAQAVRQRLQAEGVTACHLVGHSLGGAVALALAAHAPALIASLTLLAPAGLGETIDAGFVEGLLQAGDASTLRAAMARLFHDPAPLTEAFVAAALQQLQAPGRRAALTAVADALLPAGRQREDLRGVLDRIGGPVRIVWGLQDRVLPAAHAHGLPGHAAVHLLPDVGHLPQLEATPLVAELLGYQVRAAA